MTIQIAHSAIEAVLQHAALAAPEEACGLLLGREGTIAGAQRTRNVALTPESHFEIDPQALIDAHRSARGEGPEVIGYYHSHPQGACEPSATDRAMAASDGSIWAIIAAGRITLWRSGDAGFEALPYVVAPR